MSFLRQVIANPGSIGAIAPSSARLVRLITGSADLETARAVVELGPGTGAFTGSICDAIGPGTSFMTLELNPEFAAAMRARFPDVTTITGSAQDLPDHLRDAGLERCDRIICGLPWTAFPATLQRDILGAVVQSLAPGGLFLTFAYAPLNRLPRGRAFRDALHRSFASVAMTRTVLNLPPAFVYICRK